MLSPRQVSLHTCPKALSRELKYVFPGVDLASCLAVPTSQKATMDLVSMGDSVEIEKDRLLNSVSLAGSKLRREITTVSGLPFNFYWNLNPHRSHVLFPQSPRIKIHISCVISIEQSSPIRSHTPTSRQTAILNTLCDSPNPFHFTCLQLQLPKFDKQKSPSRQRAEWLVWRWSGFSEDFTL